MSMFGEFYDKCSDAFGEKFGGECELINDSLLYGLIVAAGLYVENNPYGKRIKECGEEARGIWSDYANDFSCLPNTGIWGKVAKSEQYDKLDKVENLEQMYDVLFEFFIEHIELFDDRVTFK